MAVNSSTGFAAMILGPHAFDAIFQDGCIQVYSGPPPINADAPVQGSLIGRITSNGGAWTAGSPTNGLRWSRQGRTVSKSLAQRWVLVGLGSGTAGWFRILPNTPDSGALDLNAPRIDGVVAVSDAMVDAQLRLPSVDITPSTSIEIPSFIYALPPLD